MAATQAITFMGGDLKIGDAASPEVFTAVAEVQKVAFSGNKVEFPDVTNIQSPSNYKEFIATTIEAGECSFDANLVPGNATQTALYTMRDARTKHNIKVILPSSAGTYSFVAFVASIDTNLDFGKEAKLAVKLKITGPVTFA